MHPLLRYEGALVREFITRRNIQQFVQNDLEGIALRGVRLSPAQLYTNTKWNLNPKYLGVGLMSHLVHI